MRRPPSLDAFGGGGFRVAGIWRPGSLLILDDHPQDWRPRALAEISEADLLAVVQAGPTVSEFVLLGAGREPGLPPSSVRDCLKRAGLGLEFMSTEGAARTYNLLAWEGRRVALALIAV